LHIAIYYYIILYIGEGAKMIYYTIDEVAEIMKVSRKTVYNWFDIGLKRNKIGRSVRISEEDLKEFIDDQE